MRVKLPSAIIEICRTLSEAGFQAYVVGGALRDALLGLTPHDWDITTDALPDEVEAPFPKTIPTGKEFGTITVLYEGQPVELTTMRQEGRYSDKRRPDMVVFTKDIILDLARRDFTVNAMAYNPITEKFVDPFKGRLHLKIRRLVCVGDPKERFSEDPLRMLRLIRFQAVLGFKVAKKTARGITPRLIKVVSAERIGQELAKLLLGDHLVPAFELFFTSGLLAEVIPELAACAGVNQGEQHSYDVLGHSILACQRIPPELHLRWAALLHDIGKPATKAENGRVRFHGHDQLGAEMTEHILRRLRFSSELVQRVSHLVRFHMYPMGPHMTDKAIRHMIAKVGRAHIFDLIALRQADISAMYVNPVQAVRFLTELRSRVQEVLDAETALTVQDLAVNGHDIMMELGMGPGPKVGQLLEQLLEVVIDDPSQNNRSALLAAAQRFFSADHKP